MERAHDALPASPTGGQPWALARIRAGDRTCAANQALHGEAVNLIATIRHNSHYRSSFADPLDPITFVHRITAPTYLACQWEDEQTGGHCADLAQDFTGTRHAWFTFTNGAHIDSLDPATFNRWYDFMELYVAHRRPALSASARGIAPLVYQSTMGISGVTLPPDPIQEQPSYAAARAAFETLPAIRVLFDNGAGSSVPGAPLPGFERSFARFPIPGTRARSWFLSADGALAGVTATRAGADRFTWRPAARRPTNFTGSDNGGPGGLWNATPTYQWDPNPPGTAAGYVTAPLPANTTVIGGGAVHLWIRATAPSVDLQATISEIRPDGHETFVQGGWLRADERKLDLARSTLLEPVPSLRAADVDPLPRGRYTEVTVPLVLRGSRVPARLADPADHRRPRGRSARVGVRRDPAAPAGHGDDRGGPVDALPVDPAGGARRHGADRATALPRAARRALPDIHAVHQPHRAPAGLARSRRGSSAAPAVTGVTGDFHAAISFSR